MKWTCPTEDIINYADGEYMSSNKVEKTKQHMATCEKCKKSFADLKLVAKYAGSDAYAPPYIQEKIMERINSLDYSKSKLRTLKWSFKFRGIVKPISALAAVLILIFGISSNIDKLTNLQHQVISAFNKGINEKAHLSVSENTTNYTPSYIKAIINTGFNTMPHIGSIANNIYKPLSKDQMNSIISKLPAYNIDYEHFQNLTWLLYDVDNYEYSIELATDDKGTIYINSIGYQTAIELGENSKAPVRASIMTSTRTNTDELGNKANVKDYSINNACGKINFTDKAFLAKAYKVTLKFGKNEFTKLVNSKKTLLIHLPYELCSTPPLTNNIWEVQVYDKSNTLLYESNVR